MTKPKHKRVELYADLLPGWQDQEPPPVYPRATAHDSLIPLGHRRVRIVVELPVFGGSADLTDTVHGEVEDVQS